MEGHAAVGKLSSAFAASQRAATSSNSGSQSEDGGTPRVGRMLPTEDAQVRALLRATIMPGAVRLAFTREPSYSAFEGAAGGCDHTVVARHGDRVVGIGRASMHALHRNGVVASVAYLAELRVAAGTPASVGLLRAGYAELAEALRDARVEACFTSIASDNERARRVLERGTRLGLPAYRPLARLVTLVAPVRAVRGDPGAERPSARARAEESDQATVADFLQSHAARSNLSLDWTHERIETLARHGVGADEFVVLRRNGVVTSVGAVWDQRPFRQVVIDGYGGMLRATRPIVNVGLRLTGASPLPSSGSVLAQGFVLGCAVERPADWEALWPALAARARSKGLAWLTVSRDARDPELAALRKITRGREYHTLLYDVAFRGRHSSAPWDDLLVRPEVGLL